SPGFRIVDLRPRAWNYTLDWIEARIEVRPRDLRKRQWRAIYGDALAPRHERLPGRRRTQRRVGRRRPVRTVQTRACVHDGNAAAQHGLGQDLIRHANAWSTRPGIVTGEAAM